MFNTAGIIVQKVISSGGYHLTKGKPVFMPATRMFWPSQRKAAEVLGVSANVLSKYLNGKLPKLYR